MEDRVGGLETAVDNAVDHGLPPECAKMLRDIVFRTHLDVFCRALLDDPPVRVEPMTLRLQPGTRAVPAKPHARAVRAKPRASPIAHIPGDENCWGDLLSPWVTRMGGPVCVYASVKYTEVLFTESDKFPTKEVVHGRCGGRTHPSYGVGGAFAGFRTTVPGVTPWPPRDLGAGRDRLSEKATAGVCPPGWGRTTRGRCSDGSA